MIQDAIHIRAIQHYLYCPHRFGLMYINCDWQENHFVVLANIIHERVHSKKILQSTANKWELSAVSVYNDLPEIGIYGVVDCLELKKSSSGVYVFDYNCKCDFSIIEYKPTAPKKEKFRFEDAMQIFAQKICVDNIFGCNSKCYIYYSDTKKREELPFDIEYENYYAALISTLDKMRSCLEKDKLPPIEVGKKCNGCSMLDICLPKSKSKLSIKKIILQENNS